MCRKAAVCAAAKTYPHPRSTAGRIRKQQAEHYKASTRAGVDKPGEGEHDLGSGAVVHYYPNAFDDNDDNDELLNQLVQHTPWLHRTIKVMGRSVLQPRLACYMADDVSLQYTYSGTQWQPVPFTPVVLRIKERVEALRPNTKFNSCLLNYYRDGNDHLSWHSDNEPLYGPTPTIASASFGCARDFLLRNNTEKRKYSFPLGNGAVLVMAGTVQQHWMHSVPKRSKQECPRVSLTFRTVLKPEH